MPIDDPLTLTTHELGYLLALAPGVGADLTRTILQIPQPDAFAEFLGTGAATLLVRKLATVDAEDLITPSVEANTIGENLTGTATWVEIALLSDPATEAAFISFGANSTLVLSPRALGTCEIRFLNPGVTAGRATAAILLAFIEASAPAAGYARLVAGGSDVALAVRLLADGTLELSEEEGKQLFSGVIGTDRETVADRITSLIDESTGTTSRSTEGESHGA